MTQDNRFNPPQPFAEQQGPAPAPHPAPPAGPPHNGWQPTPPPKKSWFARHKFLTALGIIAALIFIGSLANGSGNDGNASPAAQDTTNDASEENAEKPKKEKPKKKGFKIGDVAKAGDMTYKVTGVETAKTVGSDFLKEKAKGTYVIVSLDVTNNSDEAALVTSSFFSLTSGGKTFEADDMASITASTHDGGDSFFVEELNPDLKMSGVVVFDVSDSVADAKDNIFQAQTGFWGTEKVDITLSK
ncbi:DUF4352 domain-containing protein [Timonella sp. A28]|uniref:DUF4352 domain-containing protein n=1 Tax=Timonella sp. A28 TaxID=3442640 RepID=UPI003EBCC789